MYLFIDKYKYIKYIKYIKSHIVSYINMSGPWYECSGPSMEDARNEFKNYKINNVVIPESLVYRCIQLEHDKYGGFGSWRGWGTFTRSSIKKDIEVEYQKLCNLRDFLSNSRIFMNYINDLLYKPKGIRYNNVKNNFECHASSQ